jgi:hypothetical protein
VTRKVIELARKNSGIESSDANGDAPITGSDMSQAAEELLGKETAPLVRAQLKVIVALGQAVIASGVTGGHAAMMALFDYCAGVSKLFITSSGKVWLTVRAPQWKCLSLEGDPESHQTATDAHGSVCCRSLRCLPGT